MTFGRTFNIARLLIICSVGLVFLAMTFIYYSKGSDTPAAIESIMVEAGYSVEDIQFTSTITDNVYAFKIRNPKPSEHTMVVLDAEQGVLITGELFSIEGGKYLGHTFDGEVKPIKGNVSPRNALISSPTNSKNTIPNKALRIGELAVVGSVVNIDTGETVSSSSISDAPPNNEPAEYQLIATTDNLKPDLEVILEKYPSIPKPTTPEEEEFLINLLVDAGMHSQKDSAIQQSRIEAELAKAGSTPKNLDSNAAASLLAQAQGIITADSFPAESTVVYPSTTDQELDVITVFTDPSCVYCRKLHFDLEELTASGYTVRYILFPHSVRQPDGTFAPDPELVDRIQYTLCTKDKHSAIEALYKSKGESKPTSFSLGQCSKGEHDAMRNYELGRFLVRASGGTPLIMSKNGFISSVNGESPGYDDFESLKSALKKYE